MIGKDVYRKELMKAVPFILSALDRDKFSPTYGCFDREYWAWATKEFANIDLQRAVYPLSLLYSHDFKGNIYYKNDELLEWVYAGINFWLRKMHNDGSFDHLYPNEHSFVGVGFTLFEVGQAYIVLDKAGKFDKKFKVKVVSGIKKAANFLLKHNEIHGFISNHRAGAACALYTAFLITKNKGYLNRAYYFIGTIKAHQSPEGWFDEYGGFDPGYQTLDTFYQACFYNLTKDKRILHSIERSIDFLSYFMHPNGTIGGEYGSRVTELCYPSGFEMLSSVIPSARMISNRLRLAIKDGSIMTLTSFDIRNYVPFLTSYCLAFLFCDPKPSKNRLPHKKKFSRYFKESQIFVYSNNLYYCIVGVSKGGVIKVYNKKTNSLVYSDCGYFGELLNGKKVSSQALNKNKIISLDGDSITFKTDLYEMPLRVMTNFRFILFRIFNFTLGRSYYLNNLVRNKLIVKRFVMANKKTDITVTRNFIFKPKEVEICDILDNPSRKKFRKFFRGKKFTSIFMASAKYFQNQDLSNFIFNEYDYSTELNNHNNAKIREKVRCY